MTQPEEQQPAAPKVPERIHYVSTAVLATAIIGTVVLFAAALWGWYAIGPEIRARITWFQLATLVLFLVVMIGMMLSIGYSRIWADEDGVVIRNGPVLRRFTIDQVAGVRLRDGDPWAYLLVKHEGGVKRRAVLAIQSLEGNKAKRKVRVLRAWLKANGANSDGVVRNPSED